MGMPAATITSMTAHGGVVVLGFPQVLMNFMPASRITDMHVCPMVTVLVPHVGGPFILGSPTVLTGMMPQSRVTDMLVCVGPPDTCVMGATTVLVGMAGGGGMGALMAGLAAAALSVPMNPAGGAAAAAENIVQYTASLQQNGTIQTAAPPGIPLPPIALSSPGFPDLPATQTPNFSSAQPVDVPPMTTLYRVIGDPSGALGGYWQPDIPTSEGQWRAASAVGDWNKGTFLEMAQVPADGLKAWMGAAAPMAGLPGGGAQLFTSPGSLIPSNIGPAPWATASQMAQAAAQQALNGAQSLANQAQQAAQQAEQQAQQAVQAAEKQAQAAAQSAQQQAQQAVQQAQQSAQQAASQAQQAAQQAQQQAQQAVQQAQQGVQQAEQQAQQAAQGAQQQAQQAVQQAQQAAQQVQQQAQQASQQAQQAAQQAQQAATQAANAGQQAAKSAQNAIPKGLP